VLAAHGVAFTHPPAGRHYRFETVMHDDPRTGTAIPSEPSGQASGLPGQLSCQILALATPSWTDPQLSGLTP